MDARAQEMVDEALHFAESAPYPAPEDAAGPVYAEDIRRG
jgi:TPP-dependent pyruvate/acetoin dehydrogenase alpha subunit